MRYKCLTLSPKAHPNAKLQFILISTSSPGDTTMGNFENVTEVLCISMKNMDET